MELSDRQFRAITKAVSDPRRYEILQSIAAQRTAPAWSCAKSFPISAATLSFHLKELESAGLITIAREGKFALPILPARGVENLPDQMLAEL